MDTTIVPVQPLQASLREAFRLRTFWLLLAALLATKCVALLTFGHWADADECVIGIMAKHILELGVHPLYYYGQNYGGGASIEAHTAAFFYWLFGMSGYSLKAAALVYTVIGGVVLYAFTVRLAGARTGLFTLLVYITMPALVEWGLKTRGGYVTMLPLVPAILWMAHRVIQCGRFDAASAAGLLVLAAVGYWNMPHVLPLVVLVVLFLLGYRLRQRFGLFLAGIAICLLAGLAGLLLWPSRGGSRALSWIGDLAAGWTTERGLHRMGAVFTQTLPDFFQPFINDTVEPPAWPAPLTLVLFVAAIGVVAWRLLRTAPHKSEVELAAEPCCPQRGQPPWGHGGSEVMNSAPSFWGAVLRDHDGSTARPTVILLLLCVPVYVVCCVLAAPSVPFVTPRYLFPLVPILAVIAGLAMVRVSRWVSWGLAGYLLVTFAFWNVGLIRHPRLYEKGLFYDPADIRGLVQTLEDHGIGYVRTTAVLEWRILFESRERIIAVNLLAPQVRYPPYQRRLERAVRYEGAKVGLVFRKDGAWEDRLLDMSPREFALRYLADKHIPCETVDAGPYLIFVTRRHVSTSLRGATTSGV
jgi:hypothetical protein